MDVKEYISVHDNFLKLEHISSLVKWLNGQKFTEAQTIDGLQKEIRSAASINLDSNSNSLTNVHWFNFLVNKFRQLINNYNSFLKSETNVTIIREIIALKYDEGDYYKIHTDNHTKFPRTLSIILFLNDDYKGGSVSFYCAKKNQEISKVLPKAGRVIMFPSNFMYPHTVNNVEKGCRYSIVSWIN